MKPGLADLKNAIVVPHIASASKVNFVLQSFNIRTSIISS